VQAATKWKRMALKQFGCQVGEGINTDMRAVRKDYFLDHDHSYVDQWDWEKVDHGRGPQPRLPQGRREEDLEGHLRGRRDGRARSSPRCARTGTRHPRGAVFLHAEEILETYPDLPRKQRETKIIQDTRRSSSYGIGWPLKDGYPHEMRAADYDDWITDECGQGQDTHGLNGDILVWNPVTKRRHELTSMGIRVTKDTLKSSSRWPVSEGLPEAALPPGDPQRRDPAVHRRRHRPGPHLHVPAAHRAPRRGDGHGVAGRAQEDLRRAQHPPCSSRDATTRRVPLSRRGSFRFGGWVCFRGRSDRGCP
jgi:hypothetical protein